MRWKALFLAVYLAAILGISACHVTTPFFSTIPEPILPTATDHAFLDRVETENAALASELDRVRAAMQENGEDRYWAAEQLLASAVLDEPSKNKVLEALVLTDEGFRSPFVSAKVCGQCHPRHYDEWSVSPHAYAQMSPVFNAMHGTIVKLTNGTFGDFCIRCHTPVGMHLQEPSFIANEYRYITSREGVTCVVCHRVNGDYGKISGRMPIVDSPNGIFDPVYGPTGNHILEECLADEGFRLKPSESEGSGQRVHGEAIELPAITESGFCGQCHDVTLGNTFRLEEAFSEYKASPTVDRGVSCQDCHMSTTPGSDAGGYGEGPAAIVAGKATPDRKATNHMMAGPDYSVIHAGLFPHLPQEFGNPDNQEAYPFFAELTPGRYRFTQRGSEEDAAELEPIPLWLDFDLGSAWGTEELEEEVGDAAKQIARLQRRREKALEKEDTEKAQEYLDEALALRASLPDFRSWGPGANTPLDDREWRRYSHWSDQRREARRVLVERQYRLLAEYRTQQEQVLRAGYQIDGFEVAAASEGGIDFTVLVKNGTDGHNVPTGFIAERSVFLQVRVLDGQGNTVFTSGDLDPNGDVRDLHSVFVHNHEPGTVEPLWWMPLEEPEEQKVEDGWSAPTGHVTASEEAVPLDPFLFSLQSRFIVQLNRGGEREQVLAINHSPDPLPFLRPPTRSNILTGRPAGARTHRTGIPPLTVRPWRYTVDAGQLAGTSGPYRAQVRLVAGMVPVNLVYEIAQVGFDYGMSARELAQAIVNGRDVEVPQPTTVGDRGLVEVDPTLPPKRTRISGRVVVWEYELDLARGAAGVTQVVPMPDGPGVTEQPNETLSEAPDAP